MTRLIALDAFDIRFPTSKHLDGSDAMNLDPDYSAAYVVLRTDHPTGLFGCGFVFTIGRGNEVQTTALQSLAQHIVGRDVDEVLSALGSFARSLVGDSQLRWLGPEKGVMHMAIGAVINAVWDLAARRAGKPLWRYIADLTPEEIVRCIDFRYLGDAMPPKEALALLSRAQVGKAQRIEELLKRGYPA